MIHKDRVYGQVKIEDPAVLELVKSFPLQRLKGVDQAGYPEPFLPGAAHSRFEHSLGVFILLKKYGASLEEQVAGLIHDVSHTTFSHCIDYVLDAGSQKEQSHQDNTFKEFVRNSGIPKILTKYGMVVDYILDERNFLLKERELPDLCADRIDYSLRTAFVVGEIDQKFIDYVFDNLLVWQNNWTFKNFESAKGYAELFLRLNTLYYAGFKTAVMFRTVGDFLKHSLAKAYIKEDDLYTTDSQVLKKVKKYLKQDKKFVLLWQRMNNKVKITNDPKNFEAHVFCKSRIVDPLFRKGNKVLRFSDYFPDWKKIVKREAISKEYFLRFER